jgi:hypothetical protein
MGAKVGAEAHSSKGTNGSNNLVFSIFLCNNVKDSLFFFLQAKNPQACTI